MNHQYKTNDQLLQELQKLERENFSLRELNRKSVLERELADEDLRSSELKYRKLVENSPDAIAIYVDGIIVFVNNECLRLMAVTNSDELIGKPVLQFIHPDSRAMVIERMTKVTIEGTVLPVAEEKFVRPDGSVVEVEVKSMPLRFGNSVAVQLIVRDITDRIKSEQALRSSEHRFQTLAQISPVGIFRTNNEGSTTYVNAKWCQMSGISESEALGDGWLRAVHPEDREMIVSGWIASVQDRTISSANYRFLRSDGSIVWVIGHTVHETNSKGEIIGYIGTITDITERKLAEEELKNERLLLRTVIDNIPDSIYTKDIACRKTLANLTEIKYMGAKSEAEVLGKDDFDIYPRELAEQFFADDQLVIQSGLPVLNREEYVFDENQQKRWMLSSKIPLRDKDNRIIGLVGIGHDITVRKHVLDALRESEEKYRALADNGFEGIIIIDLLGNILFANQSMVKTFEYENLDDVVGKNVFHYISEESVSQVIEDLNRMIQGEILGVAEYYGITSKGNKILLESIGKIIDYNGIKADIISVHDITAKKQIEEALRESKLFLQETQQIAQLGTYTLDILTGVWTSSDILDDILGIEPDFDKSVNGWVSIIHPEWQSIMNDYFIQEVIGNKIKFDKVYKIVRQNDLSERWVRGIGRLKLDENGQPIVMLGTIRDITDQVESEKKLQEQNEEYAYLNQQYVDLNLNLIAAKEKAEESTRLKSAFLANMSHEIRTPMNGILGFAEILKEPNLTSDQQQEYLEIIEKSGVRMLNIINDIVDISKIESGQMKVSLSETIVNEQLEFIHNFFKAEVEPKGLKLSLKNSLSSSEVLMRTDREKLYAILTNLVKNAIKYTNEGSIEFGCGVVESHDRASLLKFYVKDTGIGIPKDRQEAIFERFIQADSSDKMARQGAGLGLAISKAYVEMLGGKIWVESEIGKGSTFYFTLPSLIELKKVDVSVPEISNPDKERQTEKLKILIAEDDELSAALISIVVRNFRKEIIKVRTGKEAVEACRNNPDIDLILMDIQMPEMNGYEAVRQIRQFNKKVVIIAQTAYALAGDREKAINAGCADYISKPISKIELVKLLKKHFMK